MSAAVVAVFGVVAALGAAPGGAHAAAWSRPFALSAPQPADVGPAQIAFSAAGEAAVAFEVTDPDVPGSSQAFLALRTPTGQLQAPRRVPGAQQVLGLAFAGAAPVLLTGRAPAGETCCSSVGVTGVAGGAFGARRTLASGLTGATAGSLTALSATQLLAAIATDRGVWVAQSRPGGPFAATRRLTGSSQMPWTLTAAAHGGGASTVAWTATTGQQGTIAPSQIFAASGSVARPPAGAHVAVAVAAGHQVDELALIPGGGRATVGWVESWLDATGSYESQVTVANFAAGASPRAFGVSGQTASGLVVAGDPTGDQVVAWKECDSTPTCRLWAVLRRRGGRFGAAVRLGAIDPYEDPAAAVSGGGEAVVGWIAGGRVIAATRSRSEGRFGAPRVVSATTGAGDLAVAFSPAGRGLATWTAWSAAPQLLGALLG